MRMSLTRRGTGPITGAASDGLLGARAEWVTTVAIDGGPLMSDKRNSFRCLVPARRHGGEMMEEEMGDPIEILLVEDNAGDVRLTREALEEAKVPNRLHVAQDGIAALQFLKKEKPYAGVPEPDLVLLDLNIPKRSGFEVLDQIKSDPHLRHIPVIILTSSNADGDVLRSYQSYANSYVTKPADLDQYFKVVEILNDFWLSTVRLPGQHR